MPSFQYDQLSEEIRFQNYQGPGEVVREDLWKRLSKAIVVSEKKELQEELEKEFYGLLEDDRFIPGGRIMANLGIPGREQTTLYNCYTHHPKDIKLKNCDSIDGIYHMLKAQAKTLKSEGGYGTNSSYIRPAGSYIRGICSRTPGVLKFMELWDKSSEIITEGSVKILGKKRKEEKNKIRKGAQMLVLNVWHPEIKDFITAKLTPGRLTKFNLSVGITNGFMDVLLKDGDWDLKFPDTEFEKYNDEWFGDIEEWEEKGYPVIVYETIKASELWELIMKSTYNRNDPGVLFLDIANKINPISYAEKIYQTNPCMPEWSKLLTKDGIKEMKDVNIGDYIWSKEGWTKVLNKWSTGIKKIYEYKTENNSIFNGTNNHKIVSNGKKIIVDSATTIDTFCTNGEVENIVIMSSKIVSKKFISEEEVFDITVDNKSHTFWTQGCDVSNCGEIPMSTGVCNLGSLNLVMFVKKDSISLYILN